MFIRLSGVYPLYGFCDYVYHLKVSLIIINLLNVIILPLRRWLSCSSAKSKFMGLMYIVIIPL